MNLLADTRDRARAAGRELHDATRAERRAIQQFSQQRLQFAELRDAIRRAAFAEREATEIALCLVTLERVLATPGRTTTP